MNAPIKVKELEIQSGDSEAVSIDKVVRFLRNLRRTKFFGDVKIRVKSGEPTLIEKSETFTMDTLE